MNADFAVALAKASQGDVIYFDPPYAPLSATSSFTGYTKGGFGLEEQTRLRDCALALKSAGAHILISNSAADVVATLYSTGFDISTVKASRLVNCQATGRGQIDEYLIL